MRPTSLLPSLLLSIAVFLTACAPSGAEQAPNGDPGGTAATQAAATVTVEDAAGTIAVEEMRARMGILAHDSMGGRDTPSHGLDVAAAWAAAEFRSMGLEPGGDDGAFIQRWEYTPRGGNSGAVGPIPVPNVVGLLRGSDPVLRNEWVVFSAHFDHVSGPADDTGDAIYNGADDNASGTAAVMEIAQAFASLTTPPRRSLAFILVSGEEKGLLGASHFARGASLPAEAQVADINADMVSRNWPDSIFVFGGEYSTLGSTVDAVLQEHPELNITPMASRWPQIPLFRMSDHFAFVQEGTPGIFFFSGIHDDLHRPSDEMDKVDCDKAARVARLMFYLGYQVAQADGPPAWTEEGRAMLAELGGGGQG